MARLQQIAKGILVFKMLMGAFTAISLLVGGIGITNVLLASMLERTREIGIRKAVGARHRDVLLQFLVESVSITTVGALAGAALGMVGAVAVDGDHPRDDRGPDLRGDDVADRRGQRGSRCHRRPAGGHVSGASRRASDAG